MRDNKTTRALSERGCHNPYGLAGEGTPFIQFHERQPRRSPGGAHGWVVHRHGFETDPNAPWYYHGRKVFSMFGHKYDKEAALGAAKAWAGERYGITKWARCPYGTWMPADTLATRLKWWMAQPTIQSAAKAQGGSK